MKNIYEVLRQKEIALTQLQQEIEVLRRAAELLAEPEDSDAGHRPPTTARPAEPRFGITKFP